MALLAACTTDPGDGRCTGDYRIQVAQSSSLRFEWDPSQCQIYSLAVLAGSEVKWYLFTLNETNGIGSGVDYGVVGDGGIQGSMPALLFGGNQYRVRLSRIGDDGTETVVGDTAFIRAP